MRVLICGDRNWGGWDPQLEKYTNGFEVMAVQAVVFLLADDDVIIEGDARGADDLAGRFGDDCGLEVLRFPAEWERLGGKRAGPIRNRQMIDEGKPDKVVFFNHDLSGSKGTWNMVSQARHAGIPVFNGLTGKEWDGTR